MEKRETRETRERRKAFAALIAVSCCMIFIAAISFGIGMATATLGQGSISSDQGSASSSVQADKSSDQSDENSVQINLHFTDDYIYDCWGRIHDVVPIAGCDYSVMAVEPVKQGGEYYEEYGWRTYFISNEVLEGMGEIVYGDEAKIWKITAKSCDEGGGYVHLPEFIISTEPVTSLEAIPVGYGA